jgi:hypothetical protein
MRLVVHPQRIVHCGGRLLIRPSRPGRDTRNESITNYIQFQALKNWVLKHLLPGAGTTEINYALDEARRKYPTYSRQEAEQAIKRVQGGAPTGDTSTAKEAEWREISDAMDWNQINFEEQTLQQARDAAEVVKAALQEGLIQPADIQLYRRPPADVGAKIRRDYENRIAELERELQRAYSHARELEQRAISAEARIPPAVPPRGLIITPDIEAAVLNAYTSALVNRGVPIESAKRYAFEQQLSIFSEISPARNIDEAEQLATQTAMEDYQNIREANKPGIKQIVITRGQARRDYLLNQMLERNLSKAEQKELDDLEAGAPGSELTEEIIEYEKPPFHIIAESGPYKVDYTNGFDLGAYPTRESAEDNLRFFETKGFRGRVVELD